MLFDSHTSRVSLAVCVIVFDFISCYNTVVDIQFAANCYKTVINYKEYKSMTLNIGNNIRDLRKSVDMTQEQLALRLGVSYQSVSRWENGGTYPDLELIPAIADIFSVSVDTLLGIPQKQKEEKANEAFDALRREAMKNDPDVQAVNEIIRDIRRNYMDTSLMWRFWNEGNNRLYRHPEILPEVRLTAEAYLEISSGFDRNQAIETMARIEDDNNIKDFLKKYASVTDITERALKLKRYSFRGEWENTMKKDRTVCLCLSTVFVTAEAI